MKTKTKKGTILIFILLIALFSMPLYAKDDKVQPKEYGVYIKTQKSLVRLMPNMVFDERGVFYIESNNPARFVLKDIGYFIIYGQYETNVLTFNSLLFFQPSPLGKQRYIFGKDIDITVKKQGTDLYSVKQKGLLSRGYYCLWINDTVWDFIIE
ncbi:MAG: hypothetical protein NTX75_07170 [Proteobacteria bacterium]|nr:hypothetical protein [Pseudomonadota bacterium]